MTSVNLDENILNDLPEKLAIEKKSYQQCINSDVALAKIKSDIEDAVTVKVMHTPTIYINGKEVLVNDPAYLAGVVMSILNNK